MCHGLVKNSRIELLNQKSLNMITFCTDKQINNNDYQIVINNNN